MALHELVIADAALRGRPGVWQSVLAEHEPPAYVVASGRVVAESTSSTTLRLP